MTQIPLLVLGQAFTGTILGGSGDNLDNEGITTTGQLADLRIGTSGAPDTTANPVLKVSRTVSLLSGSVFGDGGEQVNAIYGVMSGTSTNQVQVAGVFGGAINFGTTKVLGNPDAVGGYFRGDIKGSGIGAAIGLVSWARAAVATARAVNSQQVFVYNDTGTDQPVSGVTQSFASGISIYSGGGNIASCGIEIVGPQSPTVGSQFDVGLRFTGQGNVTRTDANCGTTSGSNVVTDAACVAADLNRTVVGTPVPTNTVITGVTPGVSFTMSQNATATTNPVSLLLTVQGAVKTASIQDDGDALYGIYFTGNANHQKGAIVVAPLVGAVILNGTIQATTSTILEVQGQNVAARPLMILGSGNFTQSYSLYLENASGNYEYFAANGALMTGVATGDGGVIVKTASRFWHVGGSTSTIKVGNANTLAFFNGTARAINATAFTNTANQAPSFDLPVSYTLAQLGAVVVQLIKVLGSGSGLGLVAATTNF